uniref:EGF-like domain-containing protein n=1 Tax=Palpitomonas bilix TaxID=652834 RepID=A0A7S3G4D5_9EUKA|mmetsp:Transcript_24640/g.62386  ORF Transcript_24640/g.62386 Transcript_24640/m.62386 type:complete len:863 (+) Transcript_24640:160-2748(+)
MARRRCCLLSSTPTLGPKTLIYICIFLIGIGASRVEGRKLTVELGGSGGHLRDKGTPCLLKAARQNHHLQIEKVYLNTSELEYYVYCNQSSPPSDIDSPLWQNECSYFSASPSSSLLSRGRLSILANQTYVSDASKGGQKWKSKIDWLRERTGSKIADARMQLQAKANQIREKRNFVSSMQQLGLLDQAVTSSARMVLKTQESMHVRTHLSISATRRTVLFASPPPYNSSWSPLRNSPPCPIWTTHITNTSCVTGLADEQSEAYCSTLVPSLPRSFFDVLLYVSSASSVSRMYCVDKVGTSTPPADSLCSSSAFTVSSPSSPQCDRCSPSYFGVNCTSCASCGVHGVCNDTMNGDGRCLCEDGWTGSSCSNCSPGYFGLNCTSCGNCGLHGVCNDTTQGDGSCICESGWEGSTCECLSGSNMTSCFQFENIWDREDLDFVNVLDADGDSADFFGAGGTCLSRDGLVLAAGAYGDDDKGDMSGSVIVWVRPNKTTSFSQVPSMKLVDPNGFDGDNLGSGGVSLSGNGLVLVAASHQDDEMGAESGSVLVWDRKIEGVPFSNVVPEKLLDPDGAANDELGRGGTSISSDGLVIAAASHGDDEESNDSGSVLVWVRTLVSSNFSDVVPEKLTDPNGGENFFLGYGGPALSADGLVLVAAAHQDSTNGADSGSVLVWDRGHPEVSFGEISPLKLLDPNGVAQDWLGQEGPIVSESGLIVGAGGHGIDAQVSNDGAFILWERQSSDVAFANVTSERLFDSSAVSANWLGKGRAALSSDDLVLAVPAQASGGFAGSVYLWQRQNTTVLFSSVSSVSLAQAGTNGLGLDGVALSGDGKVLAASSSFGPAGLYVWENICVGGSSPPLCLD